MNVELPGLTLRSVSAQPASAHLLLANRWPEPDSVDVDVSTKVRLELMWFTGDQPSHLAVSVDGRTVVEGGVFTGHAAPTSSMERHPRVLQLGITLHSPLPGERDIEVEVTCLLAGQTFRFTYSFRTADVVGAQLAAASAATSTQLALVFDEDVVAGPAAMFSIEPRTLPAVRPRVVHTRTSGPSLQLTLDRPLSEQHYQITVEGIQDLSGNPVQPLFSKAEFHFTHADLNSPDLWRMLPAYNRRRDSNHELQSFIACLQDQLNLQQSQLAASRHRTDFSLAAPSDLHLMLDELGCPEWLRPLVPLRHLVRSLLALYQLKGTRRGIQSALRFFLGIEAEIVTFTGRALVLGESELGADWELGPSHSFALYAFDIVVKRELSPEQRKLVRRIVSWLKPAHTHFVDLVEPVEVEESEWWVVGVSEFGRLGR